MIEYKSEIEIKIDSYLQRPFHSKSMNHTMQQCYPIQMEETSMRK